MYKVIKRKKGLYLFIFYNYRVFLHHFFHMLILYSITHLEYAILYCGILGGFYSEYKHSI